MATRYPGDSGLKSNHHMNHLVIKILHDQLRLQFKTTDLTVLGSLRCLTDTEWTLPSGCHWSWDQRGKQQDYHHN